MFLELQHFFYMGGYAFYVWLAYGIAFVVLLGNFIFSFKKHRALLRRLKRSFSHEINRDAS